MIECMERILIIEDDELVREGLRENLKLEGYSVVESDNGIDALALFEKELPDLVILDLMIPRLDGFEVCRRIRQNRPSTPIIMLTAKSSEVDKVVGLELGADDYLTKPFGIRELVARIRSLLRRAKVSLQHAEKQQANLLLDELSFDDVFIDFKTLRAFKGNVELELSAREFELLRYLSAKPDIPITRDELLDMVWGYSNYPSTRTVDNFVARLRQKIEMVPEDPQHIITVHGVGYKFVL